MPTSVPNVPPAEWLAHRYDPGHDAVHFIRVPREERRRAPFLTDNDLVDKSPPLIVRRSEIVPALKPVRINFIIHSAYCCSTLLGNAYDRPGTAFSLKEPVLLNDLVGWRHQGAPPDQLQQRLALSLAILARPFVDTEHCVIKPSNVVNGLVPAMMGLRPEAGVLLLHAPLDAYLASIASKGLWGRLWVRDLLAKQMVDGIVDFGFSAQEIFLQSDLQVAALGWLAQHQLFTKIAATWPDRVRTLDSEVLLARPQEALSAIDQLFGIADSDAQRAAIVSAVFSRHAKFGGAFDVNDRNDRREAATSVYAEELEKVAIWARTVAETARLSLDLPASLLG